MFFNFKNAFPRDGDITTYNISTNSVSVALVPRFFKVTYIKNRTFQFSAEDQLFSVNEQVNGQDKLPIFRDSARYQSHPIC